ncbi:hypothetical protein NADFUDRAFT_81106 [Nadsonia fulvescens var. elongata DSM 6958]|uniref:SH3 domain-containing protein n=1 Tax=Nadsonia fulvescens var. elongata DSM 6958 TaxID=857566 RepID=A0A1E3PRF7_9ASCO|nr:hypothetical protein NADFUDRAFT_81106 [Nadsonia fulvescens var. elongata DSM 6958]
MPNSHREFEIRSRNIGPTAQQIAHDQVTGSLVIKKKSKSKKVSSFFSRKDHSSSKTSPIKSNYNGELENEKTENNFRNAKDDDDDEDEDNYRHENEHVQLDDIGEQDDIYIDSDDSDELFDRLSSSPSIHEDEIDFSYVYALKTFVATEKGQANAVKGDAMILLNDSNSYWWLVRLAKDSTVGFLPAENIETPAERLARLNKYRNGDVVVATKDEENDTPSDSFSSLSDSLKPSFMQKKSKSSSKKFAKSVMFTGKLIYVSASEYEYSTDDEASVLSESSEELASDLDNEEGKREREDTGREEEDRKDEQLQKVEKTKNIINYQFDDNIDSISISSDDPELNPINMSTPQSLSEVFQPPVSFLESSQTKLDSLQGQDSVGTETSALFIHKTRGPISASADIDKTDFIEIEPLVTKSLTLDQKADSSKPTPHLPYIAPVAPLNFQAQNRSSSISSAPVTKESVQVVSKKPRRQISNNSFFSKLKKNRERDGLADRSSLDSSMSLESLHGRKHSTIVSSEMHPTNDSLPMLLSSPELDRGANTESASSSPTSPTHRNSSSSIAGFFRKRISSRERSPSLTQSPIFNVEPLTISTHTIPPISKPRSENSITHKPIDKGYESTSENHSLQISEGSTSTSTITSASSNITKENDMVPVSKNSGHTNNIFSALKTNQDLPEDDETENHMMIESPILWNPPDAFKSNSMTSTTSSMWSGVSSQVPSYGKVGSSSSNVASSSVTPSSINSSTAPISSPLLRSKSLALSNFSALGNPKFFDDGPVRHMSLDRGRESALRQSVSIASFHAEIDQTNNNTSKDNGKPRFTNNREISGIEPMHELDETEETSQGVDSERNSTMSGSSSMDDDTVIIHTPPMASCNVRELDRESLISDQSLDSITVGITSTSTLASEGDQDADNLPVIMTSPYSVQTSLESLHHVKQRTPIVLHPDIAPIFQASSDKLNELSNRLDIILRNI